MNEKPDNAKTETVTVKVTQDDLQKMMEVYSTRNKSFAVIAMAKLGLWAVSRMTFSPGREGDVGETTVGQSGSAHVAPAFDEEISVDTLIASRDGGNAALRGCRVVTDDEIVKFYMYLTDKGFMRSNGEPVKWNNVWQTFKNWKAIEEREARELRARKEERAREEQEASDLHARRNSRMLEELPFD